MKKTFAIAIAAVMLCVVFTADSADAAAPHMYINGHTVTGDETNSEEGWSYVASTFTLTLNNATLDDDVYYYSTFDSYSTIFFNRNYDPLNIVLIGNSTIDVQVGGSVLSSAIHAWKSINISGDGSLTITNPSSFGDGIYSYDGDITIAGGDYTINARFPIYAENISGGGGNITISGGTIHANNKIGTVGGYSTSFDMTGGYLEVSGLPDNGLAVTSSSINLHGANSVNTNITATEIRASSAGSAIISHWYNKTVIFDPNGGTCSPYSKQTDVEGKVTMPVPEKEGYVFRGWFTNPSGGDQKTDASRFSEDTTLYAHWGQLYTVTFDVNGGQCLVTSAVTGIDGKLDSLPTATREGYVFIGWFTSPSGGVQVLPDNVYDSDRTIYANWTSESGPSPDEGPSPDSQDSGDDKKGNNGLLIGGIVGGIAAAAVIAGVVIFFIRKH